MWKKSLTLPKKGVTVVTVARFGHPITGRAFTHVPLYDIRTDILYSNRIPYARQLVSQYRIPTRSCSDTDSEAAADEAEADETAGTVSEAQLLRLMA